MSGISEDALLLACSKKRMIQKHTTNIMRTNTMYSSIRIILDQTVTPKFSQISSSGSTECFTVSQLFLNNFSFLFYEMQHVKMEKNTFVMAHESKAEIALSTPSMDLKRTKAHTAWLSRPIRPTLLKYLLFKTSIWARYSSLFSLNFYVQRSSKESSNLWSIFSIS